MAIDFVAEGLLEGPADERAREARLELLLTLEGEGFSLEELRQATREDRLALMPVERMLVAPTPAPVVDAVLGLVEGSRATEERPLLRAGVACGEALPRAGDWYGRPVNLAARLTEFARRGSVVATRDVHDAAPGDYAWTFAGRHPSRG
jgi:class 3 adenylate cyclase